MPRFPAGVCDLDLENTAPACREIVQRVLFFQDRSPTMIGHGQAMMHLAHPTIRQHRTSILRLVIAIAAVSSWLAFAGSAQAGYGIQPAAGATVSSADPSFLVYLDANDSLAVVYVASSPAMTSF